MRRGTIRLSGRQPATDFDRVARPLMMEADSEAPIFQEQLVAAAAGVSGRLAVVENDLTFSVRGSLEPEREGKGIRAGEVADARKSEAVLTVQLDGLTDFAGAEFR